MFENKTIIAVVDDDESYARALERMLRAAGFKIVVFHSAEEFLQVGSRATIDCNVFDINLGGMSGLDLRRQLAANGEKAPVIFITAHDEPEIHEEARQIGCSAFLPKPVSGQRLVEAIHNAVHPHND